MAAARSPRQLNALAVEAAREFYGRAYDVDPRAVRVERRRSRADADVVTVALALNVEPTPLRLYATIAKGAVRKVGLLPFVSRDRANTRAVVARQPDPVFVDHLREVIRVFIRSTIAGATDVRVHFYPVKPDENERGVLALAIAELSDEGGHRIAQSVAITEHAGRLVVGDAKDIVNDGFLKRRLHPNDVALNDLFAETGRRFVVGDRSDVINAHAGVRAVNETADGLAARVVVVYRLRGADRTWISQDVMVTHRGIRVDVDRPTTPRPLRPSPATR